MEEQIKDQKSCLEAKKYVIADFEHKVEKVENENLLLRLKLEEAQRTSGCQVSTTGSTLR